MHSDDHPWILVRPTAQRDPDAVASLALSADSLREGKIDSVSERTGLYPGDHCRKDFRIVDAGGGAGPSGKDSYAGTVELYGRLWYEEAFCAEHFNDVGDHRLK